MGEGEDGGRRQRGERVINRTEITETILLNLKHLKKKIIDSSLQFLLNDHIYSGKMGPEQTQEVVRDPAQSQGAARCRVGK